MFKPATIDLIEDEGRPTLPLFPQLLSLSKQKHTKPCSETWRMCFLEKLFGWQDHLQNEQELNSSGFRLCSWLYCVHPGFLVADTRWWQLFQWRWRWWENSAVYPSCESLFEPNNRPSLHHVNPLMIDIYIDISFFNLQLWNAMDTSCLIGIIYAINFQLIQISPPVVAEVVSCCAGDRGHRDDDRGPVLGSQWPYPHLPIKMCADDVFGLMLVDVYGYSNFVVNLLCSKVLEVGG